MSVSRIICQKSGSNETSINNLQRIHNQSVIFKLDDWPMSLRRASMVRTVGAQHSDGPDVSIIDHGRCRQNAELAPRDFYFFWSGFVSQGRSLLCLSSVCLLIFFPVIVLNLINFINECDQVLFALKYFLYLFEKS